MIEFNTYNKGKGKMKDGKRVNKKSKKLNREVYNRKFVRRVIGSFPSKQLFFGQLNKLYYVYRILFL